MILDVNFNSIRVSAKASDIRVVGPTRARTVRGAIEQQEPAEEAPPEIVLNHPGGESPANLCPGRLDDPLEGRLADLQPGREFVLRSSVQSP
jgi:hypothetical protein